uniref:Corticotropin-releasing factor-binding protein n=1 Tax=Canis lupus familiaris TaxID=9615 RepID=A0A8C0PSJ0_CANLF
MGDRGGRGRAGGAGGGRGAVLDCGGGAGGPTPIGGRAGLGAALERGVQGGDSHRGPRSRAGRRPVAAAPPPPPAGCLDMLSLPGQFTFTADRPRLHCAAFLIAEPEELITVHYDLVSIDCRGGDFLKVFDGWILKGEKFPSSQDHPLPTTERYIDFCDSGLSRRSIRSSQNVAMIFFRVHEPGNGFTFTIKTDPNLFPCNVISQTPNGRFTLVVPHLHRNCSFSIIYPAVIKISDLTLGHLSGLQLKNPSAGCGGIGDFVELLGGTGLDPSKMMPLADLCYSFHGPAQMKIGCDNTVVRLVSSGKHINRVTFEYRQLEPYELENPSGNSIQELCLSGL